MFLMSGVWRMGADTNVSMANSDSLITEDATLALALAVRAEEERALAVQRQRHEESESLVLYDADGKKKRNKQWPGGPPTKKGKRFGLIEDKPFKPLPYVDLPVMSSTDMDQFLREQRLEDLTLKIQHEKLEDIEPDIRAPSPPPIYDSNGTRVNTREIRIRKAMLAEYNRLIRYMTKNLEGYEPPPEWKPPKLTKKVLIPTEKYPNAPFMGVIIGARGINHKHLQERSGCKIFIRGKDVSTVSQSEEEHAMPTHVHIEADTEEQIEVADKLLQPLLNPESAEFEYARTHGMTQLAKINGFTVSRQEHRCGVCGAIGHLGFECPETETFQYKMANVVCSICGDKGHVASDCKQAMEKHKKENVDWKEEAEKKQQAEADFADLMTELGMENVKVKEGVVPAKATDEVASADAVEGAQDTDAEPTASLKATPKPPPPTMQPPRAWVPATAGPVAKIRPQQPPPAGKSWPPAVSSSAAPGAPPPPNIGTACAAQREVGHAAAGAASTARRGFEASGAAAGSTSGVAASAHATADAAADGTGGALGGTSEKEPSIVTSPDADRGLQCPVELVEDLTDDGGKVLWEMMEETGAQIGLSGTTILIAGSPEAKREARIQLQAWLDVNMRMAGIVAGPGSCPSSLGGPPPPSLQAMPPGIGMGIGLLPSNGFPHASYGGGCFQPQLPPIAAVPAAAMSSLHLPPQGGFGGSTPAAMTADAWDEL
eukprot:CAMPEP_0178406288 /NCGR_PEP_ID=MMETSP0689_2-20121128/18835_1 /TAXON_ID=160604 /ORGANISM="Amphidinium massartii, Strain CS-259" /LENGTH=715 /DNA_ID=CAMNT_0020027325 /DNA_START=393 /DNA_END=2542 /DNA_ORIENTATION=+